MESRELLEKLEKWDKRIILKYNGIGGRYFTYFLRFISFFGRETIWLFLIEYFLFIWYDPLLLSYITSVFVLGLILIVSLKKIFERSRPFETIKEIQILERKPTSGSFPSWHVYNVTSKRFSCCQYLFPINGMCSLFMIKCRMFCFCFRSNTWSMYIIV